MNRLALVLCFTGLTGSWPANLAAAANNPKDLLARYHFVGTAQMETDTNAAKIREIFDLPASAVLREQTLDKLAAAPHQFLLRRLDNTAANQQALFRPLLEDLFRNESWGEIRGQSNQSLEYGLAIRLSAERAEVWNRQLRNLMAAWKVGLVKPLATPGENGWTVTKHDEPTQLHFRRVGTWCVIALDNNKPGVLDDLLALARKSEKPGFQPGNSWFSLVADLPQLAAIWGPLPHPTLWPQALPAIDLELSSKANNVRTQAKLEYRQAQSWKLDPWFIPTNLVNEPLVGFGAVRDMASWFGHWELTRGLATSLPNQAYFWSQASGPVNNYVALPTKGDASLMDQLAQRLPKYLQTNAPYLVDQGFNWLPSQSRIMLTSLPLMYPNIALITNAGASYLVGGLLPLARETNPPPKELLSQITGKDSLLYYHWEITEERINQTRHLYQLLQIIRNPDEPSATAKPPKPIRGRKWLEAVASRLGNTVTEIAALSPRELRLQRTSHIGLTGLELVLLAEWLDSPQFPLCGRELAPR